MYKEFCGFRPRTNHLQPDTNRTPTGHTPEREETPGLQICISHRNTSALSASARSGAPISAFWPFGLPVRNRLL